MSLSRSGLAALACAAAVSANPAGSARDHVLAGGESFTVALEGGRRLQVFVAQLGIDAAAAVTAPDGSALASADADAGPWGAELLSVETPPGKPSALRVRAVPATGRGGVRVVVAEQGDVGPLAAAVERWREARVRKEDALRALDDASEAWSDAGQPELAAAALGESAAAAPPTDGIDRLEAAAAAWRSLQNRAGESDALVARAKLQSAVGDVEGALRGLERAAEAARAGGDALREGNTLCTLGEKLFTSGADPDRALDALSRAVAPCRAARDAACQATAFTDLAVVHGEAGETRESIRLLNEALPLWRGLGDQVSEATTLGNLGDAYARLGDRSSAHAFLEEALALQKELGSVRGQAFVLSNLGILDRGPYNSPLARARIAEAARLFREAGLPHGEAVARGNLAMLLTDAGDPRAGLASAEEAVALTEGLGDAQQRAIARWHRGRALHRLGRLDEAVVEVGACVEDLERRRALLGGADRRAAFAGLTRMFYDAYVEVLVDRHRRDRDEASAAAALQATEGSRARSLLDGLARARVDVRRGADPALVAEEQALRLELRKALDAQVRAASATDGRAEAAARRADALAAEGARLVARIRLSSPDYADLTEPRPSDLATIREQALDDDTVLLEYALQEPRSFLWVVAREGVQVHDLPGAARIEELVRKAYAAWSAPSGTAAAEAAELSRILLQPGRTALSRRRLLVVPDGALLSLPFGALPDPEAPGDPLVLRHEVVTAPSASVLAALRAPGRARKRAASTLAVLADPVFSEGDPRVARRASRGGPGPLPRLAFSRREATALAALVPPGQRTLRLDARASRGAALGPEVTSARIVHFATHGYFEPERPRQSGLVFSLVDARGRPREGLLTTADAFNLELAADLVVLSGCRTGLGEEIRGEGLLGLTRAFMYAGAPRVVASLWTVDDAATSVLMQRFYRGMLQRGEPPARALREAQLALRAERRFASPYYWAAFQLQGDWR